MVAGIRPARRTDLDALVDIENSLFSADRISRRSFGSLMASDSAAVLVAASRDGLSGYCIVLFRKGQGRARLYSIAAVSTPEGGGVGRSLLDAAEREALRRGKTALGLEVRQDNLRAIRLYEKNAYGQAGSIPDYYADGMTALRYEKPILKAVVGTPAEIGTTAS